MPLSLYVARDVSARKTPPKMPSTPLPPVTDAAMLSDCYHKHIKLFLRVDRPSTTKEIEERVQQYFSCTEKGFSLS